MRQEGELVIRWKVAAALAAAAFWLLPAATLARDDLTPESSPVAESLAQQTANTPSPAAEPITGFDRCREFFPGELPKVPEPKARRTRDLCYDAFAILHSGQTHTPIFVVERLTRDSLIDASGEKRHNKFFADARLPSAERATLEDYRGSGYDRGHMAPAADMPTAQANDQSFSLANMVPQAKINNERTWAGIEKATRHYVSHTGGPVYVFTGPFYQDKIPKTIGPSQVWVPTHLFKLVFDPQTNRAWAYWVANTDDATTDRPITYGELVRRTGIEFLPGLSPLP